jgi:hypothetical protein
MSMPFGIDSGNSSAHVRKTLGMPGVMKGDDTMIILLILLLVLALGTAPAWPYSRGWGYYPSGTVGTILVLLIVLLLLGVVPYSPIR